ncbi:Flagellar basal-body rod protein FlgF [hydrothermal vent metagenome]|uniref:Flagellar basal-body rod protein FlgF n=1 Tax=hydrothermal vent metagenome TaxID=652676 RepID=A0A3B1BE17_9ZZZZ
MDRMLYIAMTGAKQNMQALSVISNNIANSNTTGFRSDFAAMRSMPLFGEGQPSRVYAMAERPGTDFSRGAMMTTGRDLDISVRDDGFIAVQGMDGNEAYTRAGDLQVTTLGQLVTGAGYPVMGNNGPISIPPFEQLEIGVDGTISIVSKGDEARSIQAIDRIKVVKPQLSELYKGEDGLLRLKDGGEAEADADVHIVSGTLEGSNVNAAAALVDMIEIARQFEVQTKMMKIAEQNDERTTQILRLS